MLLDAFPADRRTVLDEPAPPGEAVRAALPEHRWVHFSCHGDQDLEDPSRGGLLLRDARADHRGHHRRPVPRRLRRAVGLQDRGGRGRPPRRGDHARRGPALHRLPARRRRALVGGQPTPPPRCSPTSTGPSRARAAGARPGARRRCTVWCAGAGPVPGAGRTDGRRSPTPAPETTDPGADEESDDRPHRATPCAVRGGDRRRVRGGVPAGTRRRREPARGRAQGTVSSLRRPDGLLCRHRDLPEHGRSRRRRRRRLPRREAGVVHVPGATSGAAGRGEGVRRLLERPVDSPDERDVRHRARFARAAHPAACGQGDPGPARGRVAAGAHERGRLAQRARRAARRADRVRIGQGAFGRHAADPDGRCRGRIPAARRSRGRVGGRRAPHARRPRACPGRWPSRTSSTTRPRTPP